MVPIEEIYNNYYTDLYRYALALSKNAHIAEDITQETFMNAIKAVDRFKGDCDIRVWLCQIAKNTYFTYVKKQKRETAEPDETLTEQASDHDFVKDTMDREQAMKIHQLVHNLSEPYKEVFNLRVFGELPFREIAVIFGKTESWARVTYHRARLLIMNEMEELS